MTIGQFRAAYYADPFKPFVIHLADGRHLSIQSREFLSPSPSWRTIVVWQQDENFHIIDLLLVTDLEIKSSTNGSSKRRKA